MRFQRAEGSFGISGYILQYIYMCYNTSSFLESYEKMADVDIDFFGDHDKTDSHSDEGENVPLSPGGGAMGGSAWEPDREQETSFG